MSTLKAVRGTRDLLPAETELWNRIEATARSVFARYNFGEIRTPVFEDTALFARGVGEETDIVSKEMYTWSDGDRFDQSKMIASWTQDFVRELQAQQPAIVPNPYPGVELSVIRAPERGAFPPVVREFVSFRPTINAEAITALVRAKEQEFANTENAYSGLFQLRLVVPTTAADNTWIRRENVIIEKFDGQYFSSSQSLTLRPENTAGVVRAYIEHKLGETGQLQKLYYIGPQFRRERPQRGRYRQFSQIGAEVIGPVSAGSESPLRDAEVLEMLATLLDELGISGWVLKINSVGSASDRPKYIETLREALKPVVGQMCVDCQRRAETNPLRVLDCKVPDDQPIIDALPKIADSLDEASRAHFAAVCAALDAAGVPYERDHRLVRGLDYYTRTTFEFTHGGLSPQGASSQGAPILGAQNALLGGGRYDGLSEMIGGPKAPGIGFAMGEDRLVLTLQALEAAKVELADAYIAPLGEGQNPAALELARELRRGGLRVELGDGSFRLKKSFEAADKVARAIVLVGEDEVRSGILTVKDFAAGEQVKVARAELAGHLIGLRK
jgi:histidyl-tRNA synthetase